MENKLNLMEISILIRIYEKHPNMIFLHDLIDDEMFFCTVTNELDALVSKGIVKLEGTRSGVVCGIAW